VFRRKFLSTKFFDRDRQRMVFLATTGAMHSTPTAAKESLLGFLPLQLYVESIAKRKMHRLSISKQASLTNNNDMDES
jgi:hypothetical protein